MVRVTSEICVTYKQFNLMKTVFFFWVHFSGRPEISWYYPISRERCFRHYTRGTSCDVDLSNSPAEILATSYIYLFLCRHQGENFSYVFHIWKFIMRCYSLLAFFLSIPYRQLHQQCWMIIRLCFWFFLISLRFILLQVVNDLLNPVGQNLRIREDEQVLVSVMDTLIYFCFCNMLVAGLIIFVTIVYIIESQTLSL